MRHITQPGPVEAERHFVSLTGAIPVTICVEAGQAILPGISAELAKRGGPSAYLQMQNAAVSALEYVMPAPSTDAEHTAWWSETHSLGNSGQILQAGLVVGRREGGAFIHCHGAWTDADGILRAGHMLPDRCILSAPTTFTGWLFPDARFEGRFDPETNFTLFHPTGEAHLPDAKAALVRLRPNVEIGQELAHVCTALGWSKANIHGIGSLIGATFASGDTLESYATEFLVRRGSINLEDPQSGPQIDILIVGMDGEILQGLLRKDANAVLMTCELILLRSD
jgi:predicted DNA-binding protein with PD1-like motif